MLNRDATLIHWDVGLCVGFSVVVGGLDIFGCTYRVGRLDVIG